MPECNFCKRDTSLTAHHLIPRTLHSNKWFKKNYTLKEMTHRRVDLCVDCHRFIHVKWDEKYLGRHLNTIELLLAQEDLQRFIKFISKK